VAKSHLAILRERNRVEKAWKRERRRLSKWKDNGVQIVSRDEIRLDAARQALSWAAGDNAMAMSRIDTLNEREVQRRRRRARRNA
jgi:hypothetical protein